MRAFCSFSGGKDSVLSLFKAKNSGLECSYLLNMTEEKGERSRSHGVSSSLLRRQAELMGIRLLQKKTSWENYENTFKKAISFLKEKGIEAGIFGDIDLEEHKDWIERVCGELKIKAFLPLWGRKRREVVEEFLKIGFKAVICAVRKEEILSFLGKDIDETFIIEAEKRNIDPAGENGEFHTFVYDGPLFKKALKIKTGKKVFRDGCYFVEIKEEIS